MVCGVLVIASCAMWPRVRFNEISAKYPVGRWNPNTGMVMGEHVDSLQPVLRWEPSTQPGVTYDVVIYRGEVVIRENLHARRKVYFRAGLTETNHVVQVPLKPKTLYCWSVRLRHGSDVSPWSQAIYENTLFGLPGSRHTKLFMFITPEN